MQNNYDSRRTDENLTYAGFWVRLAAYLIDSVIVGVMLLVVRLVMSGVMSALYGTVLGGNILFSYTLKDIVLYLGEVLYFILCTRYTGTTVGKRAMNLRVISVDESGELNLLTVAYRETVGRFLCGISICIGYLIIGVDREKRGFHDMLCDTRVVYGKKVKVYPVYPYAPARPAGGNYGSTVGVPPMGTMTGNQGNSMAVPPMGTTAGSQESSVNIPPMGPVERGQEREFGVIPPTYPMPPQSGPYRMVRPNEKNIRPAENVSHVPSMDIQRDLYHAGEPHMEVKEEKGDSSEV